MTTRALGLCLLATLALACSNDDWTYRPRDSGGDAPDDTKPVDGVVEQDAATPDAEADVSPDDASDDAMDAAPDALHTEDGPSVDAHGDLPSDVLGEIRDAAAIDDASDARLDDVATVDGAGGPPSLRGGAASTTGAEVQRAGSLRLTETGFELGSRVCAGPLCLTGGITP